MRQMLTAACLVLTAGAATAQDGSPRIDEIYWHNIDGYCAFMLADHTINYDDPGSWRWVLFSNFPTDGVDPLEMPFVRIDGQLKQLRQTGIEAVDGGEVRRYTSQDAEPLQCRGEPARGREGLREHGFFGRDQGDAQRRFERSGLQG